MKPERVRPRSTAARDTIVVAVLAFAIFVVSSFFDVFNRIVHWLYTHDTWQLDELLTVALFLIIAFPIYIIRRSAELRREVARREEAEAQRDRLAPMLEDAQSNLRVLAKLVPICTHCKKVRDDDGYWEEVYMYIQTSLDMRLSEGICPECARKLYGRKTLPNERGS